MTSSLRGRDGRVRKKGKSGAPKLGGGGRAKKALARGTDFVQLQIFAFWMVVIMSWLTVMTLASGPFQANNFFNLFFTLGSQVGYFDFVWGVGISMMFLMALHIALTARADR